MASIPTLNGPFLSPISGGDAKQLVVMLHGVGSDGDDLIGLAPYFQKVLPDAMFISPHAPFAFDMAPQGYQWFSLQETTPEARLAGTQTATPILNSFIDDQLEKIGLDEKSLALIGFSQGCMMALHVGLRRKSSIAGILGFSGMLVGPELLGDTIQSRPPVFLSHGDADDVVPVSKLSEAVDALEAVNISVSHHTSSGLGHGLDDEGIKKGLEFIAEIFGVDLVAMARE